MKNPRFAFIVLMIACVSFCYVPGLSLTPCVWAEEPWKTEFDNICAKTDDAMSLSVEELKGLIERCEKLKAVMENLDESGKKVFQKRLQMCRDLFAFVLESKSSNSQNPPTTEESTTIH